MMRLSLLCLLASILIFHSVTFAQCQIDSWKEHLCDVDNIQSFGVLLDTTDAYAGIDRDSAWYTDQALALLPEVQYSLKKTRINCSKGQTLISQCRYKESIPFLIEALTTAERNNYHEEFVTALNSLASAYTYEAEYDKALNYYFQCLRALEQQKDSLNMASVYNDLGAIYYKLRRPAKALDYYNRALQLKNGIGIVNGLNRLYINIALCYGALRKFNAAKQFALLGLAACGTGCDDDIRIEGEFALGDIFFGDENTTDARKQFESSLKLCRLTGNERFESGNLVALARIDLLQGNHLKAEELLKQAESIASSNQYHEDLTLIYKEFRTIYAQRNDYKNLTACQAKYISIEEEIFSRERLSNLAQLQADFEEREHLQMIEAQKEMMRFQEDALIQQRFLNITIGCIALVLVIIVILFLRINKAKKRINAELDGQVREQTLELELRQEALERAYQNLRQLIRSTSSNINAPLATLAGLCHVAALDLDDSDELQNFREIAKAVEQIGDAVAQMRAPLQDFN